MLKAGRTPVTWVSRRWTWVVVAMVATVAAVVWWQTRSDVEAGLVEDTCFGMVTDDRLVELLDAPAHELSWERAGDLSRRGGRCFVWGEGGQVSVEVAEHFEDDLDFWRDNDDVVAVQFDAFPQWEVLLHREERFLGTFLTAYRELEAGGRTSPPFAVARAHLPGEPDERAIVTQLMEDLLEYYETWIPPDERYNAAGW